MLDDSWTIAAMMDLQSNDDDEKAARQESKYDLLKGQSEIKAARQAWPKGRVSW